MKLHIVVIRDIKANVFAQPQFVANIGGFIRSFADECQGDPEKVPSQNIQRISRSTSSDGTAMETRISSYSKHQNRSQ